MKFKQSIKGGITILVCIIIIVGAIFSYNLYKNKKAQNSQKQSVSVSEKDFSNDFENMTRKDLSETIPPQEIKDRFNKEIEVSKKAIENNKPSQERFKDMSEDYLIIAFNYQVLGQYKEAEGWYKQIIEKWPDNYKAFVNLGDLYILMGQYRESANYFYAAIKAYPETDIAYMKLADLYTKYAKNTKDNASIIYEEGAKMANYKRALLRAYAGYLELYKKDYEKAVLIWREYEKVSGDKVEQEILRLQEAIELK